jgi:large repetitive protein
MIRFKQHYWLTSIFFLFFFTAFSANTSTSNDKHHSNRIDVGISVSSAVGNVNDIVTLDVKVENYVNIYNFFHTIEWNSAKLQFVGITNRINGTTDYPLSSFDLTKTALGKLDLKWTGQGETLSDGDIIYSIQLKILGNSPTPIPINIKSAVATTCNNVSCAISTITSDGSVTINFTPNTGKIPGLTCQAAPFLCAGDLPFSNTLPTSNVPFPSLGCGSIENAHLFYFEAGTTDITFKYSAKNCTRGPTGAGNGLQFRIYQSTDCISITKILCGPQIPDNFTDNVPVTGLVVGQRYLLMMDGQLNDICDYTFDIVSGSISNKPSFVPNSILGNAQVCPNQKGVVYNIIPRSDFTDYTWSVIGGTIVSGLNTNQIIVDWGSSGGDVCLKIKSTCGESDLQCKTIAVSNTPVQNTINASICRGKTYTAGGQTFTSSVTGRIITLPNGSFTGCDSTIVLNLTVVNPTAITANRTICNGDSIKIGTQFYKTAGSTTVVLKTADGCDSIVNLNLTVLPKVQNIIDRYICQGGTTTVGGQTFNTAGNFTVTLPKASVQGCDSTINVTVKQIDITVSASKSSDITCATPSVDLLGSATVTQVATVFYEWYNAANTLIGSTPSVSVTQSGVFTLKVKATAGGVTCEKTTTVTVNKTGNQPTRPELRGDVATCETKAVTYNIVNPAADVLQFNWTVQGGTLNASTGTNVSVTWGTAATGKVCVEAQNGCGKSDTTCLAVVVGKIPAATTFSNSSLSVCPSASATYSINLSAGATNYQWVVPTGATIASGQNSTSVVVNWGTSMGGTVCVTPSNSCGSAAPTCVNVTVAATAPDSSAMTGLTSVCPDGTATISVAPNASITKYTWIVPANTTILSGQGTPSVSVRFDSGTEALIVCEIENACQLKRQLRHLVKIKADAPTPLTILGNAAVCTTDTTTYGVSGNANITAYAWTVPTGATIINGQGTQSIRVVWGTATNSKVCLEITNACNLKSQSCLDIDIRKGIIDDFIISGPNAVCPGGSATYAILLNAQYTQYKWILPANATINGANNTNSVNVNWNTIGKNDICIEVTNDCNIKKRICLSVDVKAGIDSLPITGPREVCANGTGVYTVQKDPEAISYVWFVPTGATILSGRGTNEITVRFGTTGGLIRVQAVGGCALNSSSILVSIKKAPDAPTTVTGNTIVCQNEEAIYEFTAVIGATGYKWSVPTGAIIVGSDSSQQVKVRWASATGGKLQVKSRNECSESVAKEYDVFVNRLPQPKAGADDSICGTQYTLKGISSIGTRTWRTLQKPTTASVIYSDTTNPLSRVTVSQSGRYVFVLEEKNDKCIVTDTVVITFKASPKLTLVNNDCNATGTQYILNININGGQAPYTISGGLTGTVTATNFISNPQTEGTNYTVFFTDGAGCKSDTLQGTKRCPCATKVAILKNTPIVVCEGSNGKAEIQTNATLDADDTFEYILHEGTASVIGTILAKNKTGEFAFDATKMAYDKTYFVHFIVGNNVNGAVSKTDRCYGESNGVVLIFKKKALVGLRGDTTICAGGNATIMLKTTSTSAFKVTFRNINENTSTTLNYARNNTISTVTPSVLSTYKLIEATDDSGCAAQIGDSVVVKIRTRLNDTIDLAGQDQTICIKTGQLTAVAPNGYRYSWRSLNGVTITTPNSASMAVSALRDGKNTFILTVQDSICVAYRRFDTVAIFVPTIPNALNLALEMFMGDTITSEVTENAPVGTYTVTRLTNPVNGRFDLFSNGKFTYIADKSFAGIAKFNFQICSEKCPGFCDTGDVRILIRPKPPKPDTLVEVVVPNAITPNGDGKNDTWIIDNVDKYPKSELIVFNRWGDIMYRSKPYKNEWDGTNNAGQPLPEGTYYYVLRLDLNNSKVLRGDITILR